MVVLIGVDLDVDHSHGCLPLSRNILSPGPVIAKPTGMANGHGLRDPGGMARLRANQQEVSP